MKKRMVLMALATILSGNEGVKAEVYTNPLSGPTIELQDGDRVTVAEGRAISSSAAGGIGLQIYGKAEIESDNGDYAVYLSQNGAENNLGDGTTIKANKLSSGVVGIGAIGVDLVAQNIHIDVSNESTTGSASGIKASAGSHIDLGQGGEINVSGQSVLQGIFASSDGTEVRADGIHIELSATGGSSGGVTGVEVGNGSTVNLGSGSYIDVSATNGSGGAGVLVDPGTSGSFKADHLSIIANSHQYALKVNGGTADLGTGSTITTTGATDSYPEAIWVIGGTLTADHLTINTSNVIGVNVQQGSAVIGAGSTIDGSTGTNTSGIAATYIGSGSEIVTANFLGTANDRNTIIATGSYGGSAQFSNQTLNIAYTDIKVDRGGGIIIGLWAIGDNVYGSRGVINADNVTIDATASGARGVYVQQGGEVNLTGDTVITTAPGGIAIGTQYNTNIDSGVVNGNGKMTIAGDILNRGNGIFNLSMTAGSSFTGAAYLDTEHGAYTKLDMTEGIWRVTDSSMVSDLSLNQSVVSFNSDLSGGNYITLTVENLSGDNSIFNMRADLTAGQEKSDTLIVTGTGSSGDYQINVNNQATATVDTSHEELLVKDVGNAIFSSYNDIEVGGYLFEVQAKDATQTEWVLRSVGEEPVPTSAANASIEAFSASYLLKYAETQTLLQRLGDLRENEGTQNVWAHVYGGEFTSSSHGFTTGFGMDYSGVAAGIDKKYSLKEGRGDVYVGAMIGISEGDPGYYGGSGNVKNQTLGVYGTYVKPSGFYVDSILKYGWMDSDYRVRDTAGMLVTGKDLDTEGLSASVEIGKRYHFGNGKAEKKGWYVEPQLQLSYGHESGGSVQASNGLLVDVSSYNSILGRAGTLIGYSIKGGKNPINIYGKVSYVHEFDGDAEVVMNNAQHEDVSFGDSWISYGVGVTAQMGKKHNLYLDVERASGGSFNQPWSINGGYRFSW